MWSSRYTLIGHCGHVVTNECCNAQTVKQNREPTFKILELQGGPGIYLTCDASGGNYVFKLKKTFYKRKLVTAK